MKEIFVGDTLRKRVPCRKCKGSRGRWRYSTDGNLNYILCQFCAGTGRIILMESSETPLSHPVMASRVTTSD